MSRRRTIVKALTDNKAMQEANRILEMVRPKKAKDVKLEVNAPCPTCGKIYKKPGRPKNELRRPKD